MFYGTKVCTLITGLKVSMSLYYAILMVFIFNAPALDITIIIQSFHSQTAQNNSSTISVLTSRFSILTLII
jgi:hypothetical protein